MATDAQECVVEISLKIFISFHIDFSTQKMGLWVKQDELYRFCLRTRFLNIYGSPKMDKKDMQNDP